MDREINADRFLMSGMGHGWPIEKVTSLGTGQHHAVREQMPIPAGPGGAPGSKKQKPEGSSMPFQPSEDAKYRIGL